MTPKPCVRQTYAMRTISVEIMPTLPNSSSAQRKRVGPAPVQPATPHLFAPTPTRPVRCKHSAHAADTQVVPHHHPWAQLAYSSTGVMRITAAQGTFIVPPSRAVWIPAEVSHAVTAMEACVYHTVYLHQAAGHCGPWAVGAEPDSGALAAAGDDDDAGWRGCRVLEVTDLLRAVVLALDARNDLAPPLSADQAQRQRHLEAVLLDELARAQPVPLGLPMPQDKRLRQLCEAILNDPARHTTLHAWALDAGASPRTLARLFRAELHTSFARWRQQALIARAMTLAAQGQPMNRIASALGYASASGFSAMVRRELGAPPKVFFAAVPGHRGR